MNIDIVDAIQALCNGRVYVRKFVSQSVRLSVPSIDSSSDGRLVWYWARSRAAAIDQQAPELRLRVASCFESRGTRLNTYVFAAAKQRVVFLFTTTIWFTLSATTSNHLRSFVSSLPEFHLFLILYCLSSVNKTNALISAAVIVWLAAQPKKQDKGQAKSAAAKTKTQSPQKPASKDVKRTTIDKAKPRKS